MKGLAGGRGVGRSGTGVCSPGTPSGPGAGGTPSPSGAGGSPARSEAATAGPGRTSNSSIRSSLSISRWALPVHGNTAGLPSAPMYQELQPLTQAVRGIAASISR